MAKVESSLGSNLGDKRGNIAKALSALDEGGARIAAIFGAKTLTSAN